MVKIAVVWLLAYAAASFETKHNKPIK